MRLTLPDVDCRLRRQFDEDLEGLATCDATIAPVCRPDCPEARTTVCSRHCPKAPFELTTDRDHPIENAIAPLVFELKATRVFEPVWSCEGHTDRHGGTHRKPSVWFCCERLPHARFLADAVSSLRIEAKLSADWRVSLCSPGHKSEHTIFSLEADAETALPLTGLQRDAASLARHLRPRVAEMARQAKSRPA